MEIPKQYSFQGTLLQYAKVFPIPEKLAKLDVQPGMGMNFMYILEYYLAVLGDARGKDYSEQKNKFLGGFAEMGNALVFCLRLEQTLAQLKDFNFGIHAERLPKTAGMNQVVLCAKITYFRRSSKTFKIGHLQTKRTP